MDIRRAKEEIKDTIEAYLKKDEYGEYRIPEIRQRPVLLMGPPGIGKTQIMEQIASECDIGLVSYTITHHTRQSAVGLPFIREKKYGGRTYSVTEYTMSEIIASVYDRMEQSGRREGILFIDEINCVSETLAPTMLQFLQCKTFGNQKVPEGWIIVAAGNPPEYNKSVRDFDIVTLDRVRLMNVEADFEVWKEYAYAAAVHGAVISYLDIHRDNFYRMETTVDGKRFVTARGWEDLSELIRTYEELGRKVDESVIIQYLQHPVVAKDFSNYLELFYKYRKDYQVDEILSGTIRKGTLEKLRYAPFDERVEIVSLLLSSLAGQFLDAWEEDRYISELYAILKDFRAQLENGKGALELLHLLTNKKKEEVRQKVEAGQSERALGREYRKVFQALEEMELLLKEDSLAAADPEKAWEKVRENFAFRRDTLDERSSLCSQSLEYAFDFMEAAFGESQEMVLFITELSADPHAVWFIREYDCPRYYRYNKAILFEDQGAGVRRQLDEIQGRMHGE